MGIFDGDPDEEGEELVSDTLELYVEIINGNYEEIINSRTIYVREYKKILQRLEDFFDNRILGSEIPDSLFELIHDFREKESVLEKGATEIKRIERGLKKILRYFDEEIPEKNKLSNQKQDVTNPQQIILNANPTMSTHIQLSNETKINVQNLIEDFKKELDKGNSSKKDLWNSFKKILKLLGFFI